MGKSIATKNILRMLDNRKITYKVFELSEEKHGAIETARLLNVDPLIIYKTIVLKREKPGKPILAVIPGPFEVDLKLVASFLNEKKVHITTQLEAEQMTGLLSGGISPLALINRGFQILIDSAAENLDDLHISGGQRGINIRLSVKALIELTNARMVKISSRPKSPG